MSSALFLPSLPSPPLPFHRPPFPPLPLEVGPLNPARGSGERCKLPRGLGKFVQISVLIGLYFLKCTIFDQLILMKIIKIVATRCQISTLKCTKIDFHCGSVYIYVYIYIYIYIYVFNPFLSLGSFSVAVCVELFRLFLVSL